MITLSNITKEYSTGKTVIKALDNVSVTIEKGEMLAIVGTSGAGKSTMMKIIGLVERPDSGEYTLDGKNVIKMTGGAQAHLRGSKVSFVMQDFALINQFTVNENTELPLLLGKEKLSAAKRRERVRQALENVGIADLAKRPIAELSGGQKQRVAIARALVSDSDVILADEPTGALDSKTGSEIMSLLQNLNERKGKTVIIVTHDKDIAARCKRVIEISDGVIATDKSNA